MGFTTLSDIGSKFINKKLIFGILLILILTAGGLQILKSKDLIEGKLNSFGEITDAGKWLKQNSESSDIIFCRSHPQLTYASQRKVIRIPNEEESLMMEINEENGKYLVVSPYDSLPSWAFTLSERHPDLFIPIHAVSYRDDPNQIMVIIYEIQNGKIINNTVL